MTASRAIWSAELHLFLGVGTLSKRKPPFADRTSTALDVCFVVQEGGRCATTGRWRKILEPYRKCAGAVQPCEATILSRRGIGDKEIWTKPRAACGGRGGAMGFAWVFEDSWA